MWNAKHDSLESLCLELLLFYSNHFIQAFCLEIILLWFNPQMRFQHMVHGHFPTLLNCTYYRNWWEYSIFFFTITISQKPEIIFLKIIQSVRSIAYNFIILDLLFSRSTQNRMCFYSNLHNTGNLGIWWHEKEHPANTMK